MKKLIQLPLVDLDLVVGGASQRTTSLCGIKVPVSEVWTSKTTPQQAIEDFAKIGNVDTTTCGIGQSTAVVGHGTSKSLPAAILIPPTR